MKNQRLLGFILTSFIIFGSTGLLLYFEYLHFDYEYNFEWLEERLNKLGFHLVFCVRKPESFKKAREDRIRVSGNPSQYDNLNLFIDEQELLRGLIQKSTLPVLELDISDNRIQSAVSKIADWIEETGGLWAA